MNLRIDCVSDLILNIIQAKEELKDQFLKKHAQEVADITKKIEKEKQILEEKKRKLKQEWLAIYFAEKNADETIGGTPPEHEVHVPVVSGSPRAPQFRNDESLSRVPELQLTQDDPEKPPSPQKHNTQSGQGIRARDFISFQ